MFGSLMGDGFDDLMGGHMRRMQNMMNSFFGNPFGEDPFGGGGMPGRSRSMSLMPFETPDSRMMPFETPESRMMPFGFPNMNHMMSSMGQMANNPNCHSFSSSSVMTMTTGPDGKPQVYQASSSTRAAPGGVRETKKSVCDSRTGVKKLAIGHHIGERSHIKEKEQNVYSGQLEESEEFVNLDEEEAPEFNREWQRKAQQTQYGRPRSAHQFIEYNNDYNNYNRQQLALPPATSKPRYSPHRKNYRYGSHTTNYSRALPDSRIKALPSSVPRSSVNNESSIPKDESQHQKKKHRTKPYDKRKEKKNPQASQE